MVTLYYANNKSENSWKFLEKNGNLLWQLNLNVTCQYFVLLQNFIHQVFFSKLYYTNKYSSILAIFTIANLKFIWCDPWQRQSFQISNVPAWYHRPGGTSMIARWNIIKEDQDFGTVESQKSPPIPSPISCCMPFICVSSCQNFFLKVSGVHIDKISGWGTIEYVLRRIVQ